MTILARATNRKPHAWSAAAIACMLALALAAPLLAAGCQPDTPVAAVRNFLDAIDTSNWNEFVNSVLPDNVRKMTNEDVQYWRDTALKEASQSVRFNADRLSIKSSPSGKNKANVRVTAGTIVLVKAIGDSDVVLNIGKKTYSYKDPETSKVKTEKFTEREEQIAKGLAEYKAEYYKSRWYVDFALERPAAEQQPQQQQQQQQQP